MAYSTVLLLLILQVVHSQVDMEVTSFNNIGGKSFSRMATISENAVVSKTVKVDSITPNVGAAHGGTHIHVKGSGFSIDTYGGGNKVYIGDRRYETETEGGQPLWIEAPVIEGACTVDCGGARKLVADTGDFMRFFSSESPEAESFMDSYRKMWGKEVSEWKMLPWNDRPWRPRWWYDECSTLSCDEDVHDLDVMVISSETSDSFSGFEYYTGYLSDAFTVLHPLNPSSPSIDKVEPRYGSSNDIFRITGSKLGTSLQDYRNIYFGPGRPPMGANLESLSSSALCRPEDLNAAADPDGEVYGTFQAVTVDQQSLDPIKLNEVTCRLGDFESGSYNASSFMGITEDHRESPEYVGGLTALFPHSPADLLSFDSKGRPYSVQYYPSITSINPLSGSKAGGTILTISGGGFSMNPSSNAVTVAGSTCTIISSTIEQIVCETSPEQPIAIVKSEFSIRRANDTDLLPSSSFSSAVSSPFSFESTTLGSTSFSSPQTTPISLTLSEGSDEDTLPYLSYSFPDSAMTAEGEYTISVAFQPATTCNSPMLEVIVAAGAVVTSANITTSYMHNDPKVLLWTPFSPIGKNLTVTTTNACSPPPDIIAQYVAPPQNCSDPKAANYDPSVDSSAPSDVRTCTYSKGRGLSIQQYSYMKPGYGDDSWFPTGSPTQTMYAQKTCSAPNGWGSQGEYDHMCDTEFCSLHSPCGSDAFCCLSDHFEGCTSHWDMPSTSGSSPYRKMLIQDVSDHELPCYFHRHGFDGNRIAHNKYNTSSVFARDKCNSYLDEFESLRSPSTGHFSLELCYEGTGWGCFRWLQTCNPFTDECTLENSGFVKDQSGQNQQSRNLGNDILQDYQQDQVTSIFDLGFAGLRRDTSNKALLEFILDPESSATPPSHSSSEHYGKIGLTGIQRPPSPPDDLVLWGPFAPKTEESLPQNPKRVTLSMSVDPGGPTCVLCDACFDADGRPKFNAAYFNITTNLRLPKFDPDYNPTGASDYEQRSVLACPDYCVSNLENNVRLPSAMSVQSTTDLAFYTRGYSAGGKFSEPRDLNQKPRYRLGGTRWTGFFVPPTDGNYTFLGQFSGDYELLLSPDGNPSRATLVELVEGEEDAGERRLGSESKSKRHLASKTSTAHLYNRPKPHLADFSSISDHHRRNLGYSSDPSSHRPTIDADVFEGSLLSLPLSSKTYTLTKDRFYYFSLAHTNNEGASQSLLSLRITNATHDWTTSPSIDPFGHGISGEFFREIAYSNSTWESTDVTPYAFHADSDYIQRERPIASVSVQTNGLEHACYPPSLQTENTTAESLNEEMELWQTASDACTFQYSWSLTPIITSIQPTSGGVLTRVTITGEHFTTHEALITVRIGPSHCNVLNATETSVICEIDQLASTGVYDVEFHQKREGNALLSASMTTPKNFTVLMSVSDITPSSVSLYGGTTITISGNGFAPMGVMNKLTFYNAEHDLTIPCHPRTLKNFECQLTENDPGLPCGPDHGFRDMAYYNESIYDRGYSNWYEFSNQLSIECTLPAIDLTEENHRSFHDKIISERNAVLDLATFDLTITTAAENQIIDTDRVRQTFYDLRLSFWCQTLTNCELNSKYGHFGTGKYAFDYLTYNGTVPLVVPNALTLSRHPDHMATIDRAVAYDTDQNPWMQGDDPHELKAMAGQLLSIWGRGFTPSITRTDNNYYKDVWGWFNQRDLTLPQQHANVRGAKHFQ